MLEIISTHIAELISIVAIIIAHFANRGVKQLKQREENEKHLKRKTNLILESEKQDVLIGELLLILVKKDEFIGKNLNLQKNNQQEIKRLRNQIKLFQSFKLTSKRRELLEDGIVNIHTYHTVYEKVRQLTINLESDFKKEKNDYEELITQNKKNIA